MFHKGSGFGDDDEEDDDMEVCVQTQPICSEETVITHVCCVIPVWLSMSIIVPLPHPYASALFPCVVVSIPDRGDDVLCVHGSWRRF